jgi:predicted AAA+ superfamily ATPase
MDSMIERRVTASAEDGLAWSRIVLVNGARQSGKSTLLGVLRERHPGTAVTLDDRAQLRIARTDPTGFIAERPRPMFIDEVQRGGDPLVLAIKAAVDRRPREPGQFVLAGSSRFLTIPTLTESLAGRVRIVDLWPFSQGEIDGTGDGLVDVLFGPTERVRSIDAPHLTRAEVFGRVVRGGFPEAVALTNPRHRRDFFASYVATLASRDLVELRTPRQVVDVPRMLTMLLGRTAQELVPATIGRDLGLAHDTVRDYLGLLESIYLHHTLRPWSSNWSKRAVRRSKLHALDSGVAAWVLGVDDHALSSPGHPLAGPLLESFVAGEVARQLTWSQVSARAYHFRESQGREIDVLLESADGRIVAIEVKAVHDVGDNALRHLASVRDELGDRFVNGVVVYLGERVEPMGDRITALPLSAVWHAWATG